MSAQEYVQFTCMTAYSNRASAQLFFFREVEPHITPRGKKLRKAIFQCHCKHPLCPLLFEALIHNVLSGATSSCLSARDVEENEFGKRCTSCGEWKEHDDFSFLSSDANNNTRRQSCRKCQAIYKLGYKYKLNYQQIEKINNLRAPVCTLCERPVKFFQQGKINKDTACIDHIEGTTVVRGVLCNDCNKAIGLLKHDGNLMRRAAYYVETYNKGFNYWYDNQNFVY